MTSQAKKMSSKVLIRKARRVTKQSPNKKLILKKEPLTDLLT